MNCSVNANLENSKKSTRGKKLSPSFDGSLRHSDDRPKHHLRRNPSVRTNFLGDQLRRKLGEKEGSEEDCVSKVEI